MLKLSDSFLFPIFYLIVCLCLTSLQQVRSYRDGPQFKFSSDRLVKPEITHSTPGLHGEEYSGSFVLMNLRSYYINMTDPRSYFGIILFWGSSPSQLSWQCRDGHLT